MRAFHCGLSAVAGVLCRLAIALPLLVIPLLPAWAGATTVTTAAADPASSRPGETVVVEAKVTGPANSTPTGRITIKEGNQLLAEGMLADGLVKITLPTLPLGVHELKIDYAGTSAFDPSNATTLVNVSLISGKEFTVSGSASTAQVDPVIARLSGGRMIAAWTATGQDGSGLAVYGRLLSAGMLPLAKEFQINVVKSGDQVLPSVAGLTNGGAVVVWRDGKQGLRGRILSPTGAFRTTEIDIDAIEKTGRPVVAAMASGFAVVWPTQRIKGVRSAIVLRRFTADGKPIGKLIRVDQTTKAYSYDPSVTGTADGGVAVAWIQAEFGASDPGKVRLRGFDRIGAPLSLPRLVSPEIQTPKATPAIERLHDGSLVIVWAINKPGPGGWDVLGRHYSSASGPAKSAAYSIPTKLADDQMKPRVSAFANGGYIVVWQSPDSIGNGIFARSFGADSKPDAIGFRVNQTVSGDQVQPAVVTVDKGKALAIWTTGRTGIIGQALALK